MVYLHHTQKMGNVYQAFVTCRDGNRERIIDWCGEFDTRSKAISAAKKAKKRCQEVFE